MFGKHFSEAQRVPDERSACKFVGECVGSVDNWSELDDMSVEDVGPDLRPNMQQNLEISFTQAFLMDNQFCQFYQADPKDIVRHVGFEDLCYVVEYSLCVEVFIDIKRWRRLLELWEEDGFEDY